MNVRRDSRRSRADYLLKKRMLACMFSADAMDWYLGSVKMYITVLKSEIF